jgi:hypothetical protein
MKKAGDRKGLTSYFSSKKDDKSAGKQTVKETQRQVKFEETKDKAPRGNQPQNGKGKNPKAQKPIKGMNGVRRSGVPAGNKQGFTTKQDPFVNFGPKLKSFLGASTLVDREIHSVYTERTDSHKIELVYRRVCANGVTVTAPERVSLEDYLLKEKELLGVSNQDNKRYADWAGKLLIRLGIDLTAARPQVDPKSVQDFVNKHLSPVEREVIKLNADEWDQVDTNKLTTMLSPSMQIVREHYGSVVKRVEFLVKSINSSNDAGALEAPNWPNLGIISCSKGTLLSTVRVTKALLDETQQKLLDSLMTSVTTNWADVEQEEEDSRAI